MSMLRTLRERLPAARQNHVVVPGFDCASDVYVRAILDTAQEEWSPERCGRRPCRREANGS